MERVSELSNLVVPKETHAIDVQDTMVAFRDHYSVEVPCMTAIETAMNSRIFSFTIPPSIPSELDLSECYLNVSVTLKKDGEHYNTTDQISCCQALGLLMWE